MMPELPFWWILGVAGAFSAWWVVRVFQAEIHEEVFISVIEKCIREKNALRALKLTYAAGEIPLARATQASLLESVSREDENNRPAGYRGQRQIPIDTVRARIKKRWDEAFEATADPMQNWFYFAIPTPLVFIGCIVFALWLADPQWSVIGASAAGLLVWLYLAAKHWKILRSRSTAFEALWPSFESMYHDRHEIVLQAKPSFPLPDSTSERTKTISPNATIRFDILEPGKPLRTLSLTDQIIKIGTLSNAQVQLSAQDVARLHAVIEIADGTATVIDLGSNDQTRVNLEPVTKHVLADGDVLGIGEAELVVRFGKTIDE